MAKAPKPGEVRAEFTTLAIVLLPVFPAVLVVVVTPLFVDVVVVVVTPELIVCVLDGDVPTIGVLLPKVAPVFAPVAPAECVDPDLL